MNFVNIMKQAQQMQKKLQDAQSELSAEVITAESGNGAVTITCDGQGKFKSIKLTGKAINPENPDSVDSDTIEMLEDLITNAMNQAMKTAAAKMEAKMKGIVPPGMNIPGLF